jgi:signal transduction histidine kinase
VDQEGVTGWVVRSGKPLLVPDVGQEPRFHPLPQAGEIRSELAVPLKTKEQVIGVLIVSSDRLSAFDESDQEVLQSLASQAAVAIENARLYERAQQVAVLEERGRLARELHDSVTQSLYSLTLMAETGWRSARAGDLEPTMGYLGRLGEVAQQALKEMRLLVYELRPLALVKEGLVGALQRRLDAVEGRAGVEARMLVEEGIELAPPVEEALYRIALEALNNALKHAAASSVVVRIRGDGERVELEISDNGCGFDPSAAGDAGGMGLRSMRDRAEGLGGELGILSAPGEGTRVTVSARVREQREVPR